MRRIGYGLLAFVAVTVAAGAARAQSTPLVNAPVPNISGVYLSGTPATANEGAFETWAYIASVLKFDVTDSTLDCGIVAPGTGTNVACNAGATSINSTAQLTVAANADWKLSINDGADYSALAANANKSRLTAATGYDGAFTLTLAAVNTTNGGTNTLDTTPEPPHTGATVTISGTYNQSQSTTLLVDDVDAADNFGNYRGFFTVVLHEQ